MCLFNTATLPHNGGMNETLLTERAGLLTKGDEFELKLSGEDGNWSAFVFHGVTEHPSGNSWVNAFGGDPVRPQHAHRRQWHSFDVDRVVTEANPIRPTWRSRRRPEVSGG